ncbi:hypothetical protein MOMA_00710 [Moraxella macacae 0408225]|uniref:Uncharacterized protein n=1 Tax=Moraxella macacae 0408225 TaxID=1230338 RepID=L2F8T9_9GAMM|nr:hypothetical protein MOMA_00710 [Moraxella macacae 0408225]
MAVKNQLLKPKNGRLIRPFFLVKIHIFANSFLQFLAFFKNLANICKKVLQIISKLVCYISKSNVLANIVWD